MPASHLDRLVADVRRALDPSAPDRELLDRYVQHGDAAAFEAIVRRHGLQVLAACQNVLPGADADDAFQATFLALARDARRVRSAVGGWLVVVAHRVSVRLRAAQRRRATVEARHAGPSADQCDPSWREACGILHEELDRLPAKFRQPLVLCYLRGLSRDEAARELGCTLGELKGNLERGRLRLRARLARRGLTLSAGLLAAASTPAVAGVPASLIRLALSPPASPAVVRVVQGLRPAAAGPAWKALGVAGLAAGLLVAVTAGDPARPVTAGQPAARDTPPAPAEAKAPAAPIRAEAVEVKGKVLGPDGKPVAGAKLLVIADDRRQPAPQESTAADGSFAFTLPARGSLGYRYVLATAPGFGCDWVVVPPFRSPGDVTLRLPDDVPITGRLLDLEGKPVAGARIALEALEGTSTESLDAFLKEFRGPGHERSVYALDKRLLEGEPLAGLFHATSDAAGRFTIRGVGKERVPGFIVSSPDHAQAAIRVMTRPGFADTFDPQKQQYRVVGPDFTLTLAPTKPVTGVVRDSRTTRPVAGVRVSAQFMAETAFLRRWHAVETKTDADGRYMLRGTAKGKDTVVLFDTKPGDGYLHYYAKADDTEAFAPVRLDVELQRGVVVEGRVTDRGTGNPVRAHVWYRPLEKNAFQEKTPGYGWIAYGSWANSDTATTDGDGRYKVTVLPGPGLLHVQTFDLNPTTYPPARLDPKDRDRGVYGPDFPEMPAIVRFQTGGRGGGYGPESLNAYRVIDPKPDDATRAADIVLWAGHARRLTVVGPDGKPLAGVEATGLRPMDGFKDIGPDPVALALDPDQPRRLTFRHREQTLWATVELKGTEPEPVPVKLAAGGTITGRLVDRDGKPVAGATISPSYQDHPIGTLLNTERVFGRPRTEVKTDPAGRFRFDGLPPGVKVRLSARSGKDYWYSKDKVVKAAEVLDLGDWRRE